MTDDRIALRALLEKGADATFLREMLLSWLPRAAPNGGEGADGGDPGNLRPGCVHPQRGRSGPGHGHDGISKSQVSRLCGQIDERVQAFLTRLIEGDWPYVWLDATCVKARRDGHIVSVAVIIAVGAYTDSRREVLGMTAGNSEAEPFWTDFLRTLARRGFRGIERWRRSRLVVSDARKGLKAAITKALGVTWQRWRVHFMRNAMAHAGKTQRRIVSA